LQIEATSQRQREREQKAANYRILLPKMTYKIRPKIIYKKRHPLGLRHPVASDASERKRERERGREREGGEE